MIHELIDNMQSSRLRVAYLVATNYKPLNIKEVGGDLVMMNTR